jgi:hypothetical protein
MIQQTIRLDIASGKFTMQFLSLLKLGEQKPIIQKITMR